MSTEERAPAGDPLVSRAVRLFEFLARAQQLKAKPPRTVDAYESVLWFADLPEHPAVTGADPEPGDTLLTIDRVPRFDPPDPGEELARWLDGRHDDPEHPPELRDVDDEPDIRDEYDDWLGRWRAWAGQELLDRPVRKLYADLFATYLTATSHPEDLELVIGVGCLAWTPDGHPPVKRHLLTAPVAVHFDDDTGRLSVTRVESVETVAVELDMLDPGLVMDPNHINEVRARAKTFEAHPLHSGEAGSLVRRLVHTLDGDGEYRDLHTAPENSPRAVAAFAPAIILRRRSQQGLADIFRTIVGQLTETGKIPDGVLPLIDPNHEPPVARERVDGAVVLVDDDPFLPLPVNDVQLRILHQVDTKAQTLVQGPPGTGKTHTAAALLSHLLAQGKRVLVTAHTDRALKEVRAKLPEAIRPLAVSIVGTSREDMSDLKVAVSGIANASAEHDAQEAHDTINGCLAAIDRLRRRRAELHRRLVNAREHEVREHEHAGYRGTLAAIAQRHRAEADRFSWLTEYADVTSGSQPPLDNTEITEWHGYLLDDELIADEPESRQRLFELSAVPEPREFADLVAAEQEAAAGDAQHVTLKDHTAFDAVSRLQPETRAVLRRRLHQLAQEADELAHRREAWMNDALADVRSGRAGIWRSRGEKIGALIERANPLVDRLGPLTEIVVSGAETAPLEVMANGVRAYLNGGGKLKTTLDGAPKIGALTPKAVKQAQPLFERVRVNGLPPTTSDQLDAFVAWAEATKTLAALDRAWPDGLAPAEDTLLERLQWHVTELDQLRRVLRLGAELEAEERRLAQAGLPHPDWNDLDDVHIYASLVDAAAAQDARTAATEPLRRIEQAVDEAARWESAAPCVRRLLKATRERDHDEYDEYAAAYDRVARLHEVRGIVARRDQLTIRLAAAAPAMANAISEHPQWRPRLAEFTEAWAWASTGAWVRAQRTEDVNALQNEVSITEKRIREQVEKLAATRAWNHAVSPQRLTGRARADLELYAQLVRRLGKGTGPYAAQRRAEVRQAMDRCRPAVPVWIMPVYRIAEQLRIQPDMFDVVIVDEASQAGLEATFLQYLAPKIVVIGDDKQVSPSAVGVDQQQLRDLAAQYLADNPDRAAWQDPKRSLFDEARMRFGGRLTLVEHRRCVPEIIGFSNSVAYEPDGIRLIPVRQFGADRLEPIKAVFVPDGYERGTTNRINPVEVGAVVAQIEKCIADPRYDGKSFGVISLLGEAQAKAIQSALLIRIEHEEWVARDLRCGDSADFQGSERDVMFLSMVAAPDPQRRLGAATQEMYVQRYNVAASRARDQMWVFHSLAPTDLGPEDMRVRLLDYCYGVMNRGVAEGNVDHAAPEDLRVDPFESLFEQRVFNRLLDHGFTVIPQYLAEGYRINLVVVGAKSRLAIECDGDTWHGADAYERDLARQRDLERCGWQFFRIRESEFYLDEPAVLDDLWAALRELGIHPFGKSRERKWPN